LPVGYSNKTSVTKKIYAYLRGIVTSFNLKAPLVTKNDDKILFNSFFCQCALKTWFKLRVVIYVQPFMITLTTTFIFSLFIGPKQLREKKKGKEWIKIYCNMNMKDKIIKNLS